MTLYTRLIVLCNGSVEVDFFFYSPTHTKPAVEVQFIYTIFFKNQNWLQFIWLVFPIVHVGANTKKRIHFVAVFRVLWSRAVSDE